MRLGIIIPMLNEATGLADLCEHLVPFARAGVEIVFVDGGSGDGSENIVRAAGFHVLASPPGRARQMNAGAAQSRGDALLFLHADSRLPEGAVIAVTEALRHHRWGRFDVRIAGKPVSLRLVAALMNWRSRLSGIATGDQGLFMTRQAFEEVGGFPEQPLMEDIAICRALRAGGSPACLPLQVVTSGRRWETRGVWRTIALMWWLRWRYWIGAPVEDIAKAYR